jgi:hypothetical protein
VASSRVTHHSCLNRPRTDRSDSRRRRGLVVPVEIPPKDFSAPTVMTTRGGSSVFSPVRQRRGWRPAPTKTLTGWCRRLNVSAGRYKRTPTSANACKRALTSNGAPSRAAHRCRGSAWPGHHPIELAYVAPRSFQYISVYFCTFTSQFLAARFLAARPARPGRASSSGASGFGVASPRRSIATARGTLDHLTARAHIPRRQTVGRPPQTGQSRWWRKVRAPREYGAG